MTLDRLIKYMSIFTIKNLNYTDEEVENLIDGLR